jgi:hypothetical protein
VKSAKERIQREMLANPGEEYALADLAHVGGCTEAGASARFREIAREWKGLKREVRPGVFLYSLTGERETVKSESSLSALRREVAELREVVARLEKQVGSGR